MNQKLLLILIPIIVLIGFTIYDNLRYGPEGYCMPNDESCNLQSSEEKLINPKNQKSKNEPIIEASNNTLKPGLTEKPFININNQKFLLYRVFLVSELTDDDFIGLYDLLEANELILFIFNSTETHRYFNDHVPTGTDVIWINDENTVINIASVPYCKDADKLSFQEIQTRCTIISSEGKYLLEAHNGFINKHKIEIGSKTEIHLLNS